ncbi:hypothetical protein DMC30DRAFT_123277 [Rhodotorula diobovata]|uniref:DUF4110 domain-containing protein n=1 Tax=Rhodotorula diobovata TaxID=5288 RepID=A0A5C5G488_9BASI|nr:hypothetical protein DMC30DRAFT_123277 [Rhodotorula diobovata]
MGKAKSGKKQDNAKAAAKKAKQEAKAAKTDTKQIKKKKGKAQDKEDEMDEGDFLRTLEEHRQKWAEEHKVTEDIVEGPPSRRANATLTASPVADHLYLFGGEYYDGQRVELFADLYRYDPGKNEWRRFTSPTQPSPRAAHAAAVTTAGGGRLWIHGGEYSAPNQNSFYHYHDLWSFSFDTNSWERWDVKTRPSARSGHRMAVYKNFIFLFGGFQDTGIRTTYLNDLWAWSLTDYRWYPIEISAAERKPPARSGFSFLPTPDGLVLHGGYCKTYENKRVTGVALNDTWQLKVPPIAEDGSCDFKKFKWEKRKNPGNPPNPTRSGCTMAYWANKQFGILFGGVTDDDKDEETLESTFYNELFGYSTAGNGRWVRLMLKQRKKMGGTGGAKKKQEKRKAAAAAAAALAAAAAKAEGGAAGGEKIKDAEGEGEGDEGASDDEWDSSDDDTPKPWEIARARREMELAAAAAGIGSSSDPSSASGGGAGSGAAASGSHVAGFDMNHDMDDPEKTVPGPRYNPMCAVLRNTLYLYGGILEAGNKEYTLCDFHTLDLSKMDRYTCLRDDRIDAAEWHGSDSENDDDSDSDDEDGSQAGEDDEGEREGEEDEDDGIAPVEAEPMEVEIDELALTEAEVAAKKAEKKRLEQEELTKKAQAFLGVSTDAARTAEDILSTPQPGESLAAFFARSKDLWTARAHESSTGARGKELRRDGFALAEQRYEEYKPILEEITRLQEAAGAEAVAARASARAGLGADSRNRR